MVIFCLLFTSPEPIPPFTVLSAPMPRRATDADNEMGRIFSFFNRTMPSSAAFSAKELCFFSQTDISGFKVPLCLNCVNAITL